MIRRTGLKPWVMVVAPLLGILVVVLGVLRLEQRSQAPAIDPAAPRIDAITGRPPGPEAQAGADKVVEVPPPPAKADPLAQALQRFVDENAIEAVTASTLLRLYQERQSGQEALQAQIESGELTEGEARIREEALRDRHRVALKQLLDEDERRSLRQYLEDIGEAP